MRAATFSGRWYYNASVYMQCDRLDGSRFNSVDCWYEYPYHFQPSWGSSDFFSQINLPGNQLIFASLHATHHVMEMADGTHIGAFDPNFTNLSDKLIATGGCHAGLAPPDRANWALFFAQSSAPAYPVPITELNDGSREIHVNLTVVQITQPDHGVAEIADHGRISYTADANFVGSDAFSYTVSDSRGGEALGEVILETWESDAILDVALVIDASGSMNADHKMDRAKRAACQFVTLLDIGFRASVVSFNAESAVHYPLNEIQSYDQIGEIRASIDAIQTQSGTCIGGGMETGLAQLASGSSDHRQIMILLSDGQESFCSDTDQLSAEEMLALVPDHVDIFTIGFGQDADHDLLTAIADSTQGDYLYADDSNDSDPSHLHSLFRSILIQTTDQGMLALYSDEISESSRETQSREVYVDDAMLELTVSLTWENSESDLDLSLITPDGEVIDSDTAPSYPEITHIIFDDIERYHIVTPNPGAWTALVSGESVVGTEHYQVALYGQTWITLDFDADLVGNRHLILLSADAGPASGVIEVEIETPTHQVRSVALYDDGYHGDGAPGDGRFGAIFPSAGPVGLYDLQAALTGVTASGSPFIRLSRAGIDVVHEDDTGPEPTARSLSIPGNRYIYRNFNLSPNDPRPGDLFSSIEDLEIVATNWGGVYIPEVMDNIGWTLPGEVYQMFVGSNEIQELTIEGYAMDESLPLVLQPDRYNWFGHTENEPIPIEQFFSGHLEDVLIVIDHENGEFYIPGLVNDIVALTPHVGYSVYLSSSDPIVIDYEIGGTRGTPSNDMTRIEPVPTEYFVVTRTGVSYPVVVTNITFEGEPIPSGSEVAIYDGSQCVGATKIIDDRPVTIAAWLSSEDHDLPGFTRGAEMRFKVWVHGQETDLEAIYEVGGSEFGQGLYSQVALSGKGLPSTFALLQNRPNPFNPTTTIEYALPSDYHVRLNVYNISGQLVRSLVNEPQDAGTYQAVWNGRNDNGERVASGIYFYRIEMGSDFNDMKRMVLLK
ncbi:MAG: hypothetical protein B6244_01820 [Candidatus Cloacimonetes bacterium 4572_55]|nr:MAG: hypothetical protein B6244_01820 [Candidatus Cloacimonetes bacterium 4572_55]